MPTNIDYFGCKEDIRNIEKLNLDESMHKKTQICKNLNYPQAKDLWDSDFFKECL